MADNNSEIMAKVLEKMLEAQGKGLTIGANDEAVLRISDGKSTLKAKDGSMNYDTRYGMFLDFENEVAAYEASCLENADGTFNEVITDIHTYAEVKEGDMSVYSLERVADPKHYLESLLEGGSIIQKGKSHCDLRPLENQLILEDAQRDLREENGYTVQDNLPHNKPDRGDVVPKR